MGPTQLTVPNSMSSSYDRDDSSDDADDQPVVDGSDVVEETTPQDLSNIKRILDQCHVLYKCKVDQHNRKVRRIGLSLLYITDRLASCLKF